MHNDISEILFTEKQLADRVGEIGAAITSDYADVADEGIILISVLRGAAIFMADLARKIELPLEMDYMPSRRTETAPRAPAWCVS